LLFAIYRKGDRIKDPNGGFVGYEIVRVGLLEITDDMDQHSASGVILQNHDSAHIGDLVKKEGEWIK